MLGQIVDIVDDRILHMTATSPPRGIGP